MRTKISILLILISLLGYSQQQPTWFGGGVRLYNATEQTSFSLGHERIPLMQTNGVINSFIHSDSLVVQSQIKPFITISDVPVYQAGSNITIDNTNPLSPIINASGGGGGTTNLSYTGSSSNGIIASSTGTSATIPTVTSTNAGLQKPNFYEEGTFTPDIIDTNGGATYAFTISGATYVRIGNVVRVNVHLTNINTTGTPSPPNSYFYIDNMPFVSKTGNNGYNAGELIQFAGSTLTENEVQNLTPFMQSGFDRVRFSRKTEYQPRSQVSFTAGVLAFSITYITNVYTP